MKPAAKAMRSLTRPLVFEVGWTVLCDVAPTKAIPLETGIDPFYAIKPAPDMEIEFEGGVCFRNSVWLAGYPPRIKLLGLPSAVA